MALSPVGAGALNVGTSRLDFNTGPTVGSPTNGITLSLPAGGQAGDLAFALMLHNGPDTSPVTTSTIAQRSGTTGWTLIDQLSHAQASFQYCAVFWKVIAAGEANPAFTVSCTESGLPSLYAGCTFSLRGADASTALDGVTPTTQATTSATAMTAPAVTSATANAGIVRVWFSFDDNEHLVNTANGNVAILEGADYTTTSNNDGAMSAAWRVLPAAGDAGTDGCSQSVNGPDRWSAFSIVVRDATAAAPSVFVSGYVGLGLGLRQF